MLKNYMISVLGLDRETADRDACKLEHVISIETVKRLLKAAEKSRPEEQRELYEEG